MKHESNLTTDIAVISNDEILLIKRKNEPFKEMWALPGGFVDKNETILNCAKRELQEETSLILQPKFHSFYDDPNRDPRGRYISFAHVCYVNKENVNPIAKDDAKELNWFNLNNLPPLAFDHYIIIQNILNIV